LIVIGQDLLIAGIFLFGQGNRTARNSGALLMLGITAHLFMSDNYLAGTLPAIEPLIALLAMIAPVLLWLFARAVFEAPWPNRLVTYAIAAIYLLAWATIGGIAPADPAHVPLAGTISRLVSLAVVGHALWIAIQGRPDDLVEKRRAFRLLFVGVISLLAAGVLFGELILAGTEPPDWLKLADVIIIAVVTLGLAIPTLRLRGEFFEPDAAGENTDRITELGTDDATAKIFAEKLRRLMDDGYYRETGLTIPTLADKIDLPEHQLRRLINGHLNYRNFSAFLNSYRIAEAREQLADPDKTRSPVLTIALGLGYASLGPFNRAFKEATGTTPTDYRRQHLGAGTTDSE